MTAAALGLVLGAPSLAAAQEGWYVSGGVGYGAPGSATVSGALGEPTAANGGRISGKSNWRQRVALGYQFDSNWRIEGEFAHRYNDTGAIGNHEDSRSKFHAYSGMVNVLYDFDTASPWRPYVGAGLGWVQSRASLAGWNTGTRPVGSVLPDPRYIETRDSDTALGYQLIAGIGWALTQNLTLDTEYRYFGYSSTSYTPGVNVDALRGHEAWVGLRYLFAAPPPPPPPPPPP
ncbi:outer membrane protein, partial [Alkalicaulis satelles]